MASYKLSQLELTARPEAVEGGSEDRGGETTRYRNITCCWAAVKGWEERREGGGVAAAFHCLCNWEKEAAYHFCLQLAISCIKCW